MVSIERGSELQTTEHFLDEMSEVKRYLFGHQAEMWILTVHCEVHSFRPGWAGEERVWEEGLGEAAAEGCAVTTVAPSSSSLPSAAQLFLFKFMVKVFSREKTYR